MRNGVRVPPTPVAVADQAAWRVRDRWMKGEIKSVANVMRTDVRGMLSIAAPGIRPIADEGPLEPAKDARAWLGSGEAIRAARALRMASS